MYGEESLACERARLVEADALDANSLLPTLDGVDVGYYLIHSMAGDKAGFADRDRQAARNFATAAKQAGVQRIIYLGALTSQTSEVSLHLKSRHETGGVLREFGPPVTEFRAGIIVGDGSVSFEMIRYLTERLPVMICPRWVITRTQPIAIGNVIAYLVAALGVPESVAEIIEIAGATVETYRSMMLIYARARGLRRWLLRVPVLPPRLSSYWLNLSHADSRSHCSPTHRRTSHRGGLRERISQETISPTPRPSKLLWTVRSQTSRFNISFRGMRGMRPSAGKV